MYVKARLRTRVRHGTVSNIDLNTQLCKWRQFTVVIFQHIYICKNSELYQKHVEESEDYIFT